MPLLYDDQGRTHQVTKVVNEAASNHKLSEIRSCYGIALHMHQPTVFSQNHDLASAHLISNLEYMWQHQDQGDNHNAPVFLECYSRPLNLINQGKDNGHNPRLMLDYSGNLLWGLASHPDYKHAIENLKKLTEMPIEVEFLGTMWSHAVVSSTPVADLKLHMLAWRHSFAELFGTEAVQRVTGFSPPEMHLPIHPDVCYEYVKALLECGYNWLMVQEHTIENLDGSKITNPHVPHILIAKNSDGQCVQIICLIKTQGSDTKLVGQMQPFHEAMSTKSPLACGSVEVPCFVLQIGDGENGGVMMNEFPPAYICAGQRNGENKTFAMNGSEYLSLIPKNATFQKVQPISQNRIWNALGELKGRDALEKTLVAIKKQDPNYSLEKASWTSDRDWVRGYENVLDPMNKLSALFHEKFDGIPFDQINHEQYNEALLYLLLSQTSCFRYWNQGVWTDIAKEICRRGMEALKK